MKRKSFERRFEICQRGAFENCLRSGVPDGRCSTMKTVMDKVSVRRAVKWNGQWRKCCTQP